MTQAITAVGTQVFLGPPVRSTGSYLRIGELASMTPIGREWDVNDVTNFDSPIDKEKIKGLRNPGQYDLVGNRIFDDASQAALKVAFDDPRPYWFQVVFPINPYTGAGEIWTFAALVLSIDPPKIAPNKALQFFCKLQATGARQTSNGYGNAVGEVKKFRSVTLGGYTMIVTWSDFLLPAITPLPSDAVILGIYPVIIASGVFDICFQNLTYGDPSAPGGSPRVGGQFTNPFHAGPISPGASFASTEFYAPSIGTSLSDLAGQQVSMSITSSLLVVPPPFLNDEMAATGVAYAIYYASSKPKTNSLMPPPFAVPAGQGLAWALPFTVAPVADAGQGNTGTATGTAATLNSI